MKDIILDRDWYFHRGDVDTSAPPARGLPYISAKTERYHEGPASRLYVPSCDGQDSGRLYTPDYFEKVTLPHDYIVGGIPDEKNERALGFFKYENAWYIKRFTLPEDARGKRVSILFDGVATRATVYLNSCLVGHSFCGYCPFEFDITDICRFGDGRDNTNVLAVYVNTEEHEGWWYEGAGIYRDVHLRISEPVSVDLWGVYVKPVFADGKWTSPVEVTVRNDTYERRRVTVKAEVKDAEGHVVASSEKTQFVSAASKAPVTQTLSYGDVRLWSPEDPYQYYCSVTVTSGACTETAGTKFGFRTFYADPRKGFFINGKHYKIKGICGHADCGLTGKAVPDNIHRYKVRLMKEMGANGYRCSHYPQAAALMDALDENGFIVMDETRWFDSSDECLSQLRTLVRRDRNRPGVFFWSVGNEEPLMSTEQGARIFRRLREEVLKLDDTRIITAADDHPDTSKISGIVDAIGINYNLPSYERSHEKYPEKPIFASECCATGTTRGWYFAQDDSRAFLPAWDRDTNSQFLGRERTWQFINSRDWILGMYQWIAFEHRGEATWPRLCSQSGAVDLYLQKKDAFFQNKSFWTDEPTVHLLPHWNFRGLEGEIFTVRAYTNCDEAELFLNGESLGRVATPDRTHAEWQVKYAPGELRVTAYRDGKAAAEDVRATSGPAARLMLEQQTDDVRANGRDIAIISCYCVDKDGNEVYDASPTVEFSVSGSCAVYSTGSDITDHSSLFLSTRRMRAGRIGVAVKLGTNPDGMKLYARADGLESAVIPVLVSQS